MKTVTVEFYLPDEQNATPEQIRNLVLRGLTRAVKANPWRFLDGQEEEDLFEDLLDGEDQRSS